MNREEHIRKMLSRASTLQELEGEMMGMVAMLHPYPIVVERVKGIFIVERVIRHRSFMYYQGRLMHILGNFTLHGKRHLAWYTLSHGWCEIPMGVPLNQLGEQGTIDL